MPVGVTGGSKRFELKTLPEGFVVIKSMTYGQKLTRGDLTSKMKIQASRSSKDVQGEIDLMQRAVALWEYANLIEDHNIEDVDGRKLNFKDQQDVNKLGARIGEEISTYIGKLNNFEEDDNSELGKSSSASAQAS